MVNVCLYKKADLCIMDVSIVLTGMPLSGKQKKLDIILAEFDPVAVAPVGNGLPGHDPRRIEYLELIRKTFEI